MSDPFGEMPASHYVVLFARRPGTRITDDWVESIAQAEDVTPAYVRRALKRAGIAIEAVHPVAPGS